MQLLSSDSSTTSMILLSKDCRMRLVHTMALIAYMTKYCVLRKNIPILTQYLEQSCLSVSRLPLTQPHNSSSATSDKHCAVACLSLSFPIAMGIIFGHTMLH